MKRRFLSFLLALIMCLASFHVTALADIIEDVPIDHGFKSEIAIYTGGKCDIQIVLHSTLTGELLSQAELKALQPYAVIRLMDGSEYRRDYFSSAEMTLNLTEPGNYLFSVCKYEDGYESVEMMIEITEDLFTINDSSEYAVISAEECLNLCVNMIVSAYDIEIEGFSADEVMNMNAMEVKGFIDANGFYNEEFLAELRTKLSAVENGRYLPIITLMEQDEAAGGAEISAQPMFADVPEDEWYSIYVAMASDTGLLNGKSEGVFAPNDNMTIAEAITLAARMDLLTHDIFPQGYFEIGSPWYQPYVDYAKENGLPWQYTDYNVKITREEFAHIFNAIHDNNKDIFETSFGIVEINAVGDGSIPDVPLSSEYAADIYKLYRLGILGGSDAARNFFPESNIKRSEVAAIICRLLGFEVQEFTL